MNALSMRDHSEDNARLAIQAALLESFVPLPSMEQDMPEYEVYVPVSDDGPEYASVVEMAFLDAFDELELDPQEENAFLTEIALDTLMEHQFEYLNSVAPITGMSRSPLVGYDLDSGGQEYVNTPDIGESDLEIGKIGTNSIQDWTVTPSYTILVEGGVNTPEADRYHTLWSVDAFDLFWAYVEKLMSEDPLHIYGQLITDALSDAVTKDLICGFVQWWDEDLDDPIPADGDWIPRGVYLYATGQNPNNPLTENATFEWYNAATGKLSSTQAGWCMGPLVERTAIDTYVDGVNAERQVNLGWVQVETSPEDFCDLCSNNGTVTVITHDGEWLNDFACPNCDCYEMLTYEDTFEVVPMQ